MDRVEHVGFTAAVRGRSVVDLGRYRAHPFDKTTRQDDCLVCIEENLRPAATCFEGDG